MYPGIFILLSIITLFIDNSSNIWYYLSIIGLNITLILNIVSFPYEYKLNKLILLYKSLFLILISIIIYSWVYYKMWEFIINWNIKDISYYESLYFSLSMWVNLWYSYILPQNSTIIISVIQAFNGYFYLAYIIVLLGFLYTDIMKKIKLWKIKQ